MPRPLREDFEPRLRNFRRRARLTQEQLAELVGVTPEMVRKHEKGDSLPIPLYRARYARLFKVAESELWVFASRSPTGATRSLAVAMAPAAPLRAEDLDSARAEIPRIVAMDNRFGGADMVKVAGRLFRSLQVRRPASTAMASDFYAVLAEVAEVVGWMAYDAELHPLARQMNHESLHYARMAGDRSIELLTTQNMSMHAGALGRPDEALALVQPVLDDGRLTARVRALFMVRAARARAQLGDESALGLFDQIRSLFLDGLAAGDAAHFWWVDERELDWHEAMAASDLGRGTLGVDFFERSVEAIPDGEVRSHYVHRAYLLQAQVAQGAWAGSEHTAASLLPLALEVASTRADRLLEGVVSSVSRASLPGSVADSIGELTALVGSKRSEGGSWGE